MLGIQLITPRCSCLLSHRFHLLAVSLCNFMFVCLHCFDFSSLPAMCWVCSLRCSATSVRNSTSTIRQGRKWRMSTYLPLRRFCCAQSTHVSSVLATSEKFRIVRKYISQERCVLKLNVHLKVARSVCNITALIGYYSKFRRALDAFSCRCQQLS